MTGCLDGRKGNSFLEREQHSMQKREIWGRRGKERAEIPAAHVLVDEEGQEGREKVKYLLTSDQSLEFLGLLLHQG